MRALALVVVLLPVLGCGKKKDDKAGSSSGGGGGGGGAGATASGGEYADVDCEKMVNHVVDLMLNDPTHAPPPEQKAALKAKLEGEHAKLVQACVDERGVKKLTHKQYDCILNAKSMVDMGACMSK